MPMQMRNLRVFCDVVARHSFSKAASDNDMTQSGASQAVQQLEEYLQVKLIDRGKRPFVLTPEGLAFHEGCQKVLRQFDQLTEEVRSIGRDIEGQIAIGSIYSVGLSYLPNIKKAVNSAFPKAEVRFQFGHPDEVYRLVEQGRVDFGLVSYPKSERGFATTDWHKEQMILAATPNHSLATQEIVASQDLTTQALVAFAPNLRIRHEIDRYLRQLGITMQIAAELDNIDSVRHAMEVNAAVAFLPRPSVQEEIEKGNVVELNCPWLSLTRPLGIVQRKNETLSRPAQAVMDLIAGSIEGSEEDQEITMQKFSTGALTVT
ncbi:MAG: LysR family transcriptional regulator [Planctomycetota bacterium]